MEQFTFSYGSFEHRWLNATLADGEQSVTLIASAVLYDAPSDLLGAAVQLLESAPIVGVRWFDKPGEYRCGPSVREHRLLFGSGVLSRRTEAWLMRKAHSYSIPSAAYCVSLAGSSGYVSAEAPLTGGAHQAQILPVAPSRPQDGHRTVVTIDQPIVSAPFSQCNLARNPSGTCMNSLVRSW